MSSEDPVSEKECSENRNDIYCKIDRLGQTQAKILGGIIIVGFFVGIVSAQINQRFSSLEKYLDKLEERIFDGLSEHDD